MKRASAIAGLIALVAVLLFSIGRLFALRFERGDVYPPYSSLRMDPLGARALADALELMPNLEVRRNYRPLVRLKPAKPVTLVYLGLDYHARWEDEELAEFEKMVKAGSHAVFAFHRELYRTKKQRLGGVAPTPSPGATPTPAPGGLPWEEQTGTPFSEVGEGWGFKFDLAQEDTRKAMEGVAEPTAAEMDESIPWHSALYFKGLGPEWETLYKCNNVPVVISRKFGEGRIVLCSDSYFVSNEGLSGNPPGRLLESLFATLPVVVFDEEHLGVTETPNIATLARRMRLGGVIFALVMIAVLYIWKQSSSLLPRQENPRIDHDVTGTAANEGFINLLHRSISPSALLHSCVAAWTRARGRLARPEERTHIDAILRAHGDRSLKDTAAAYRSIAEGLKSK